MDYFDKQIKKETCSEKIGTGRNKTFGELTSKFTKIFEEYCCKSNVILSKPTSLSNRHDYIHAKN